MTNAPLGASTRRGRRAIDALGLLGLLLLGVGSALGLFVAPTERFMGDVFRIVYIHAPTAWAVLVTSSAVGVLALGSLSTGRPPWDDLLEAGLEVAGLMIVLLLIQGALWSRPTWGSYWSGDPRFFSTAALALAMAGILMIRSLIDDPRRRARSTALATAIVAVVLPITLKSVDWWPAIHPPSPDAGSLAAGFAVPIALNSAAMTLLSAWLIHHRSKLGEASRPGPATPR